MTVVGVIQARLSSARLPGKVLLPLAGSPVFQRVVERVRAARSVDEVIVATSTGTDDDELAAACTTWNVRCVRGPLDDVLARFCMAIRSTGATTVVRMPADKPLCDPDAIDALVTTHVRERADYTSNMGAAWPDDGACAFGLEIEVASAAALLQANDGPCTASDREHVMPYLYRGDHGFKIVRVPAHNPFAPLWPRLTLDTHEDYELISRIYAELISPARPIVALDDVRTLLLRDPELVALNVASEQRGVS